MNQTGIIRIFLLTPLLAVAMTANSENPAASLKIKEPTAASVIGPISMDMSFAEVQAALPTVHWDEATDAVMNRHVLKAKEAVTLAGRPFSLWLSSGEAGLHELTATWGGHDFKKAQCQELGASVITELEKRFGYLKATPQSKFGKDPGIVPVEYQTVLVGSNSAITVRSEKTVPTGLGNLGGYVEWQADGAAVDGLTVNAGGNYFGEATLRGAKNDCGAFLTITNLKTKPIRPVKPERTNY